MLDTEALDAKIRARRSLPVPAEHVRLRRQAGLSQDDLARSMGVTRSAVSRWESGQRVPQGAALVAYAELLERLRRTVAA